MVPVRLPVIYGRLLPKWLPSIPAYVRNADGSIMVDNNGIGMMDYGSGINAGMQRPFIADANPILDNKLNTRNSEGNAINGNAFVDITPIEGLKVTFNGAFNLDETRHSYVYNPYYGQFDSTGGTVSKYHTRTYELQPATTCFLCPFVWRQ